MPSKIFNYELSKTFCNIVSIYTERRNDFILLILEFIVNNILCSIV